MREVINNPYLEAAKETLVFNTDTQEGDPDVLYSLKHSVREKARGLLDPSVTHNHHLTKAARKAFIWTCDQKINQPDPLLIAEVFAGAGFESHVWIIK